MAISKRFRYKDKEGKVTDYEYGVNGPNVTQDANHRLVTDKEKETWNGKANPEDIPSGAAADYGVANNDTTNRSDMLVTAQVAYQHGREIDQLISELTALKQDTSITDITNKSIAEMLRVWIADGFLPDPDFKRITKHINFDNTSQVIYTANAQQTFFIIRLSVTLDSKQYPLQEVYLTHNDAQVIYQAWNDNSNLFWGPYVNTDNIELIMKQGDTLSIRVKSGTLLGAGTVEILYS